MKTKLYAVRTEEEALALAAEEFGISEDELVIKVVDDQIEVTVGIDPIEKGKQFLLMLLRENNIDGNIEKMIRDNIVSFNINAGEFNGVLIGRNSKHLLSLQILVNTIINNYFDSQEQMVVKIDVGGYRNRRERNLERLAVEYGKEVSRTKQPITLDGLNAYERKVIHDRLSTWKGLKTHSEGVEPKRYLIIEYVKNAKD